MSKRSEVQPQIDRRSLIKTAGMGALIGGMGVLASQKMAHAQEGSPDQFAFWVHGNAAVVQFPDRITAMEHRSTSLLLTGQAGTENWIHIPFSNTVFHGGIRPRLLSCVINLRAAEGVFFREASIYDGEAQRGLIQDLAVTGEFVQLIEPFEPTIFFGLGISARIEFTASASTPQVEVMGAGINMIIG